MSRTTFVVTDLPPLGQTVFKLLKLFRLIDVKQEEGTEGMVSINNLTIINFVLKLRGPTHERTLTNYILLIQVTVWSIAQVFMRTPKNSHCLQLTPSCPVLLPSMWCCRCLGAWLLSPSDMGCRPFSIYLLCDDSYNWNLIFIIVCIISNKVYRT